MESLLALEPAERARIMCILFEELGWGDSGLAICIGAGMLAELMSTVLGNEFCRNLTVGKLGCWGITEPDHGTDMLDPNRMIFHPQGNYGRPNCVVTIKDDEIIIKGQKSAWVSNGTIGQVCILYAAADTGSGPSTKNGAVVIVPGDAKGVSRGKPLDKMGQRALNQGEIFFDDVHLSKEHLLAGPDQYQTAVYAIHTFANTLMGAVFTGCARSAYDLAHAYAHERKAGGVPIIRHQSVAHRLFHMFRKVEASCALGRRVAHYNFAARPAGAARRHDLQGHRHADRFRSRQRRAATLRRQRPDPRLPDRENPARRACVSDRGWLQRDPGDQGRLLPHQPRPAVT